MGRNFLNTVNLNTMKETEFLRKRNVIPKDGTDLIIGFDNNTKESLIGLLKEYHESELKKLRVTDVSVSVCPFYMSGNDTSGKCNNCGKNKWEH